MSRNATDYIFGINGHLLDLCFLEFFDCNACELSPLLNDGLVCRRVFNVGRCLLVDEQFRHKILIELFRIPCEGFALVEIVQQLFNRVTQSTQKDSHRQFAASVDSYVQNIFCVEFKIEPRTAIRDHTGRIEQLARCVRFSFVVFEEDTGASMQLAYDHALGAVNNEGAVFGHQRNFSEVDLLLLHVTNGLASRRFVVVPYDKTDNHTDRRGKGHSAAAALMDVVFRLVQVIADKFERRGVVKVLYWKGAFEDTV